jgi:hypothetical protein
MNDTRTADVVPLLEANVKVNPTVLSAVEQAELHLAQLATFEGDVVLPNPLAPAARPRVSGSQEPGTQHSM